VEMQGTSRDEAVHDFLSGKGWYHGADVDRLSEEEAASSLRDLIRRVEAQTPLPKKKLGSFSMTWQGHGSKCVTSGKHLATNPSEQRCAGSKTLLRRLRGSISTRNS